MATTIDPTQQEKDRGERGLVGGGRRKQDTDKAEPLITVSKKDAR